MRTLLLAVLSIACMSQPETSETTLDVRELPAHVTYTGTACPSIPRLSAVVHFTASSDYYGFSLDNFWQRNCPRGMNCQAATFTPSEYGGADYLDGTAYNCSIKSSDPIVGACWMVDGSCYDFFQVQQ